MSYAQWKELNNGWRQFVTEIGAYNPTNGLYSIRIGERTDFKMYIDVLAPGDTLCKLTIDSWDEDKRPKIFYTNDDKSIYFFDVFFENTSKRFSIIRFEYDKDENFTTGFNSDGSGQNSLAVKIATQLLKGNDVKFVVNSSVEKYQEIKEMIIPGIK